jgi:hypothetical protein
VVQIFRELRHGQTEDGKTVRVKSPSSTLSTAEAISVINSGMALAGHFGDGVLRAADVASGLLGAVIKDPVQDTVVWKEYLETVVKERSDWKDLYRACREQLCSEARTPAPLTDRIFCASPATHFPCGHLMPLPLIHFFGIRHHGPGCARSLLQALEAAARLPAGGRPARGEALLPMLQSAELRPPVAMLVYMQDEPSQAAFYPFAEFSPEWQALQWASRQGVATRFIDLPQTHGMAIEFAERARSARRRQQAGMLARMRR